MKKALLIVAQKGFQAVEYSDTKKELEKNKIEVKTCSLKKGKAYASNGMEINVDLSFADVNADEFDAVAVIGGPGALDLRYNDDLKKILKKASEDKIVGAICISPVILADSGLLKGKKATVWNDDGKQESTLKKAGAEFTEESVTIDKNIITANGPGSASDFGDAISSELKN